MRLSIIVPVYNMASGNKLSFCLDSLLQQNLQDFEVIAVDDCSTDNSLTILREYASKYPNLLRIIALPENHRQGGAKNAGLDAATGEYIGFTDSDDWVSPDMFAKLLARAKETGADIVGCHYCLTNQQSFAPGRVVASNHEKQSGVLNPEKYKSLILDTGSLVVKIYKRELFEAPRLRFPEHMFYEDNAVATTLMLRAKHFELVDEALYFYYQHMSSTVHTISKERCLDRLHAMDLCLEQVKAEGYLDLYYDEICFRYMNLAYMNTLFTYMYGPGYKELSFIRMLGRRMKEVSPDFTKNPYYQVRVNAEEKKLMELQQKSTLSFVLYYKMLYFVRGVKKKFHAQSTN